jgi:hypothetical protein
VVDGRGGAAADGQGHRLVEAEAMQLQEHGHWSLHQRWHG